MLCRVSTMGTTRIIDVDAHAEPAPGWLDDFPDLAERLPDLLPDTDPRFALGTAEMFAWFVSDDLLRQVPADQRMPMAQIVNPAMELMFSDEAVGLTFPGSDQYAPLTDSAGRVAWLDERGIEKQNVITGGGYTLARAIEDPGLSREALEAVNTWMAGAVGDHGDRLLPVACLRYDDLDWAVAELKRARARGSRSFLVSSEPAGGIPPSSPGFDPVWATATELGMVPLLHIGMSPAMIHPGWADLDDPGLIRLLSILQPAQSAEIYLTALVMGGVFERHPTLTLLVSELGIDWLPRLAGRLDAMAGGGASPLVLGEYRLPMRPSEYLRRNLRVSPLPSPDQSPVRLMEHLPGVAVFSSDFPHFEGNGDPLPYYEELLAEVDSEARAGFLGASIAEVYERMGDPL
jgi:predicted TIM-barrel fold metal-dependent hydrolase